MLASSFLEHHPGATLDVLVVDSEAPEAPPLEPVAPGTSVLGTEDLGIGRRTVHDMAMIYDVTEMATAVKPALLRHLLERYGEPVMYLDPDIVVFDSIEAAHDLARRTPIVLTPHVLSPLPRDGARVRDEDLLVAGQFNLGFIAVGPGAEGFLDWWHERTVHHACNEPASGMFTDQRWIDFVPALFDHHVVRDPGWNVAYWNLHERPLSRDHDGRVLAGGATLRFLHLSGFDPASPHLLSRHTLGEPRVLLSDQPVLAELAQRYAEQLRHVGGDGDRPYGYDRMGGGPIPLEVRRTFRTALLQPDPADGELPEPFSPEDPDAVLRWLNAPVVAHPGGVVTRLERMVWTMRVDLQVAFGDLAGQGGAGLSAWAAHDEWYQDRYGHLLVGASDEAPSTRCLRPGANVLGYMGAELGVGEVGRLVVRAAEAGSVPHTIHRYTATHSRQHDPTRRVAEDVGRSSEWPYAVSVMCVNADSTPRLVADAPGAFDAGQVRVGVWFWELEEFPPALHGSFGHVDELWVASEFVAAALRPHAPCPVRVMPLVVEPPPPTHLTRADVGLPDGPFVFGFHFDAFSVPGRKNPTGVLQAYLDAFGPDDGTHLIVKSINGDSARTELERLRSMARGRPDVEIRDGYLSRLRMSALVHHTDAYVSLHRSEGYGLTMASAMAAGKPVVATGYSGNLQFMTPENSILVPYERVPVGAGNPPYDPAATWAEPDLSAATSAMRALVDDPVLARRLGLQAQRDVRDRHSAERAGAWLRDRVLALSEARSSRRVGSAA
ncbi:glycosyltransferase [Actinomarinicola tropica]|uniref:Glycosyltransferase n=1 Tax=Actinomarinicola tropica TaxID=2789776 RepID=A0A5Q2RN10_9ACTN|nr:glycosyltransferase [Actinomarinicola tropica]QGG96332.1 glycosyltransferase [Actinomarinicola tropica]